MYNSLIMTPDTAPSAYPQAESQQPVGMSEGSRLAGVFFEPKKAFTDIAARPRFIVPLILMILMGIGVATLYSQKGVMRIAAEQQMANNPQIQQLAPDQKAQALERGMKITTIIGYCIPILIPVSYLVMALVLWAIVSGILSAPVRFGQVFAIVTYAQLPSLLMSILAVIVLQLKGPADFNVQNPLMFNPGAFMDPQSSPKFIYSIASSLDLFTIWVLLLVATGLKAAGGKRISFGGALFAVMLPWAVIVLGKAALAGLTG
ncbi:MAG: YIP1 family protein [Bryobacteraceae bacterium]|jgi:Yip1 domain